MQNVKELWKPVIGRMAWGIERGHGSVLKIEFGLPHLCAREPMSSCGSEKIRRHLARRSVYVQGDWNFWVLYGNWKLLTSNGNLDSEAAPGSPLDECLTDLDGQRLVSIEAGKRPHSCVLRFDFGAVLEIWPSAEIADDQWTLHVWNGDIAAYGHDGGLTFSKAQSREAEP
jgi:hypothetical protein